MNLDVNIIHNLNQVYFGKPPDKTRHTEYILFKVMKPKWEVLHRN